jgi:hypothetical protein
MCLLEGSNSGFMVQFSLYKYTEIHYEAKSVSQLNKLKNKYLEILADELALNPATLVVVGACRG